MQLICEERVEPDVLGNENRSGRGPEPGGHGRLPGCDLSAQHVQGRRFRQHSYGSLIEDQRISGLARAGSDSKVLTVAAKAMTDPANPLRAQQFVADRRLAT